MLLPFTPIKKHNPVKIVAQPTDNTIRGLIEQGRYNMLCLILFLWGLLFIFEPNITIHLALQIVIIMVFNEKLLHKTSMTRSNKFLPNLISEKAAFKIIKIKILCSEISKRLVLFH